MEKNEIVTAVITDFTKDGEGIGRSDGYTLFVKDAVIGDVVRARITRPKKNYAYARVEEILTASPDRTVPRCAEARRCGGCKLLPQQSAISDRTDESGRQGRILRGTDTLADSGDGLYADARGAC